MIRDHVISYKECNKKLSVALGVKQGADVAEEGRVICAVELVQEGGVACGIELRQLWE